jgi:hypothetical protein
MVALEPETLNVYPPTEITADVVSVTSLYAANASDGSAHAAIMASVRSFFIGD